MSKESMIEQLIKLGIYKTEDKRQLWELSSKELQQLLEGRVWTVRESE